ncbi:hypothetical protein AVEN_100900-1 [Araneus ventricosus]|uniref:Uncharacterized protein n=1 Tax=Araneus ventricosus TaxID=182803 RepID=A0A4Y2AW00_ARAVE|nr:hypothetical protein AVEN_100900-1 [Araneus ventricosus]
MCHCDRRRLTVLAIDSGNRRQLVDILPLSVRVQAVIQLFIPINEYGRPILRRSTLIGVCASSVSDDRGFGNGFHSRSIVYVGLVQDKCGVMSQITSHLSGVEI